MPGQHPLIQKLYEFVYAEQAANLQKLNEVWERPLPEKLLQGCDVAGKTEKLRKSYRTTQAILSAANQMLAGITQTDPDDYLQPDFEGMDAGTPALFAGLFKHA